MKKVILGACFLLSGFFVFSTELPWALKKGTIGVGIHPSFQTTKLGSGDGYSTVRSGLGFSGRYSITNLITTQFGIGFGSVKNNFGPDSYSKISGFDIGLGIIIPFRVIQNEDQAFVLSPLIGINFFNGSQVFENSFVPGIKDDLSAIQFNLGVQAEWFFTQFFTIQGPFSISLGLSLFGTESTSTDDSSSTEVWTFSRPSETLNFVNSTLGFHYYFF